MGRQCRRTHHPSALAAPEPDVGPVGASRWPVDPARRAEEVRTRRARGTGWGRLRRMGARGHRSHSECGQWRDLDDTHPALIAGGRHASCSASGGARPLRPAPEPGARRGRARRHAARRFTRARGAARRRGARGAFADHARCRRTCDRVQRSRDALARALLRTRQQPRGRVEHARRREPMTPIRPGTAAMRITRASLAFITLLIAASPAAAEWPARGKFILLTTDSFHATGSVWIDDLSSGDLLVRAVGGGGNSNGYNVQRISALGDFFPEWPSRGASFGEFGKGIREWAAGFTVDDFGFTWMQAQDGMAVHLVDGGGALTPPGSPWPLTTPVTSKRPAALAPAPGGIYAYFGNRLQRFGRSGFVAVGWPAAGVPTIPSSNTDVAAIPDGASGVVIMATFTPLGPAATRFDANGVAHAGWAAGGIQLSDDPNDGLADFSDVPQLPDLQPSDASHYFAAWTAPYNSPVKRMKVQRLGPNGLDPAWPTSGIEVVAPDTISGVTLLPDRSGGLYVLWYAHRFPLGTHLRADGSFEPGTGGGVPLLPAGVSYHLPQSLSGISGVLPYVPADVTPDGRLMFAWDDDAASHANPRSIRVRWLLPNLTADPSEPSAGRQILTNERKWNVRAVHAAPDGGAYLAWARAGTDTRAFADNGEIWMTRILPSSLVGVAPPAPRAAALALSAPRPNPARGSVELDVTLPDDSPARVELLDVAGRVVRFQTAQGAGAHAISFGDLETLSPGLYFARVSTRAGERSTRVVVSQ